LRKNAATWKTKEWKEGKKKTKKVKKKKRRENCFLLTLSRFFRTRQPRSEKNFWAFFFELVGLSKELRACGKSPSLFGGEKGVF
jgi:hypothetical protein